MVVKNGCSKDSPSINGKNNRYKKHLGLNVKENQKTEI